MGLVSGAPGKSEYGVLSVLKAPLNCRGPFHEDRSAEACSFVHIRFATMSAKQAPVK
jgi:hypothetical protein